MPTSITPVTIPPVRRQPEVLEFLLTRRSRPARTLTAPVPTRDELGPILTAAARVPDHGKLEPWRFVVLERPALVRLAALAEERGRALGLGDERRMKGVAQFADSFLAIAVVKCARSTEKIAETEQLLSAGAVCISLLNAAQAAGWGGNWLTGWAVEDEAFRREGLGLQPGEWVAGLIHLGTEGAVPPERPRPDLARIVTWLDR
ncbi:MAG: nitroreductase [Proteobacteria bacterium]|nr:nitroreductase [Pseudomonadota bacterium]MBS0572739.1 nitroreductase [Pseudomonadota bacterium]